ncbi:MAG: DUF4956 domain-containing protein [Flavobacteriales bacterium]|nr:DUF4956 domain-containing protein [Flavobacteriales bacterium]
MQLLLDFLHIPLLSAKLFGIKYYDVDFLELLVRLAINTVVSYTIILYIFRSTRRDSEYIFTYLVFSPVVFFICHLFSAAKLSIGFAFGLFAVFSILRYRTTTIPVKEMTYMFIIIAVSVINAISTKKVSHAELMFTNAFLVALTFFLERFLMNSGIETQIIMYENIVDVRVGNEAAVIAELTRRTGLDILRYEVIEADYMSDAARLRVYYRQSNSN